MAGSVMIWGWDGTIWREALVDAAGHLQVDIIAAPAFVTHCYGWDGAAWQTLLVEDAVNFNLRTRLYTGANPIGSQAGSAVIAAGVYGLFVNAALRGWDGTQFGAIQADETNFDAQVAGVFAIVTASRLHGFNGATWDRLRTATPADAFATPTFALQVASFLMGYDGADWNMLRVDAAGHLQTDVLSSALPTGAATAANQATIIGHIDGIEGALGRCYGYDGADWQTLLVESAALKNLRVKLYDGANGIESLLLGADTNTDTRGLVVYALNAGRMGIAVYPIAAFGADRDTWDTTHKALFVNAQLHGFDGTSFERLRTYATGILKVGRAEIESTTVRMVAAGPVVAGAHNLYWVSCNPAAGNSVWEITDAIIALQPVVFDHFHTGREGHLMIMDPPMKFTTGIYLETFTNMTSVVLCYV